MRPGRDLRALDARRPTRVRARRDQQPVARMPTGAAPNPITGYDVGVRGVREVPVEVGKAGVVGRDEQVGRRATTRRKRSYAVAVRRAPAAVVSTTPPPKPIRNATAGPGAPPRSELGAESRDDRAHGEIFAFAERSRTACLHRVRAGCQLPSRRAVDQLRRGFSPTVRAASRRPRRPRRVRGRGRRDARSDVTTTSDAGSRSRATSSTMRSSAASRPARVAYATSTPSCTPSGTSASGRPSSTTEIRSPLRRASSCSDATSRRAAPWRSRHQPSGRLPITLLPSTISRRRPRTRARSDDGCRRARPSTRRRPRSAGQVEHVRADDRRSPGAARRARGAVRRRAASRAATLPSYQAGSLHLRPLVGAHHHDVVARGDVGDRAARRSRSTREPRPRSP